MRALGRNRTRSRGNQNGETWSRSRLKKGRGSAPLPTASKFQYEILPHFFRHIWLVVGDWARDGGEAEEEGGGGHLQVYHTQSPILWSWLWQVYHAQSPDLWSWLWQVYHAQSPDLCSWLWSSYLLFVKMVFLFEGSVLLSERYPCRLEPHKKSNSSGSSSVYPTSYIM